MSDRAAAIIIQDNLLLLIHRYKFSNEYYVFPGGHVEEGETYEQACIREVYEETGLKSISTRPAFEFENNGRQQHYFFVEALPGPLSLGEPERTRQSEENLYIHEWAPLSNLDDLNVLPARAIQLLQAWLKSTNP